MLGLSLAIIGESQGTGAGPVGLGGAAGSAAFGGAAGAAGFSGSRLHAAGNRLPCRRLRLTTRRRRRGFGFLGHSYGRYKPPAPWASRRTLTFNSLQTKCQSGVRRRKDSRVTCPARLIAFDQLANAQGIRLAVTMAGDRRSAA